MTGALDPGEFVAGSLELVVTFGCVLGAAYLAVHRWSGDLSRIVQAVAMAVVTICGLLVVEVVPLAFGALTRAGPPIGAALLLLAAWRVRPPSGEIADSRLTASRALSVPSLSGGLGLVAVCATVAVVTAWIEVAVTTPVQSTDALNFHFPGVINFIRSGSLWHVTQYLAGQAQANYPQNGDILLLTICLPWHSLAFVRYVDIPLLTVAGLAIYATARELGAGVSSATLTALLLLSIPPVLDPALGNLMTDPCFVMGFAAGMLFLVRHGRTQAVSDLTLAGLGLGIAFGTKWYGLTDVPALVLVWALLALRRKVGLAVLLRAARVLVGCIAAAGGIWLLRNLILTGNPVFDYRLSVLGVTILPAPPNPLRARIGFSLAHYLADPAALRRYVWPAFRQDFGFTGLLIVLGAPTALVLSRRARGAIDHRFLMLAVAALLCAIAYAITPYSAQGLAGAPTLVAVNTRYGVPALILGAPLLAVSISRARRLRPFLDLVLFLLLLINLHRDAWTSAGRVALNAAVVGILLAVAVLPRSPGRSLRRPSVAGLLLSASFIVALGVYHYQRVLSARPYSPNDPTVAFVLAHAPTATRIGVAGIWSSYGLEPVAPMFGPRFGNQVGYVGPFRDHRLEQYASQAAFVDALHRDHYRFLEIGKGIPPAADPVQARWARAAGYRTVIESPRLILMAAGG